MHRTSWAIGPRSKDSCTETSSDVFFVSLREDNGWRRDELCVDSDHRLVPDDESLSANSQPMLRMGGLLTLDQLVQFRDTVPP